MMDKKSFWSIVACLKLLNFLLFEGSRFQSSNFCTEMGLA